MIPDDKGLKVLKFININELTSIQVQKWYFSQLMRKAENLETLSINKIKGKKENKEIFLKVALDFIRTSNNLRNLSLVMTNTEAEAGHKFLKKLANSDCQTIENLDLSCPETDKMRCKWFEDQLDEPVEDLIYFIEQ